jgi:hypothetical protein
MMIIIMVKMIMMMIIMTMMMMMIIIIIMMLIITSMMMMKIIARPKLQHTYYKKLWLNSQNQPKRHKENKHNNFKRKIIRVLARIRLRVIYR